MPSRRTSARGAKPARRPRATPPAAPLEPTELDATLATWTGLNDRLPKLDEPTVCALLDRERLGRNRLTFVLRLHSRLNRLRRERERRELVSGA